MADRFQNRADEVFFAARSLRAVTPHDTNELPFIPKALRFDAAGTVSIIAADDTAPVTLTVIAGEVLVVRARIVRATGTSATGIVALI